MNHPARLVDDVVWNIISAHLSDPARVQHALGLSETPDTTNWEAQLVAAGKRLAKVQREVDEAMKLRRQELLTFEQLSERLKAYKRDRETLERTADVTRRSIADREAARRALGTVQARLSSLAGTLDAADFATRRAFIEAVIPDVDGYGITYHPDGRLEIRGALDLSVPGGTDDGLAHPTRGS